MQRRVLSLAILVAIVAALTWTSSADALVMMLPGPMRVANADAVIVGRVAAIEPQDVVVANVTYRIAVVEVKQALRGAKDAKTVRIGFMPPPVGKIRIRPGGFRGVQLQAGQEGLFLLKKHPQEKFLVLGGGAGNFVSSANNANFDKDLRTVKALVKVAADPWAGLKSKDAEERVLAASVLIEKYRAFQGPGKSRQEAIPAAESKLILLALADADWNGKSAFGGFRPNPAALFNRLGINAADGWTPPQGANFQTLMPTWLRDHADTFRMQRYVPAGTK